MRAAVLRQTGDEKLDVFYRPDFVAADKDKPVGMDHVCLTVHGDSALFKVRPMGPWLVSMLMLSLALAPPVCMPSVRGLFTGLSAGRLPSR